MQRFMCWARLHAWERIFADLIRDDRELYKQRNPNERCFNALRHFRRVSTQYRRTIEACRYTTALPCA